MLCPTCEKELKKTTCEECGKTIYLLGAYCYECGSKIEENDFDLTERILCSDDTCIGTINEKGICNVCGKPYKL
ncbi:MAG: hypothetical protein N2513_02435 [Deltaproteobacteria bacterium]|nr:hypothetical protein [Deltaproteobacteria bacterium]